MRVVDDAVEADALRELHRDDVARERERRAQRDRAHVAVVVVLRRPHRAVAHRIAHRRVVDDRVGGMPESIAAV